MYNDHPKGLSKSRSLLDFKKANICILKTLLKDPYYNGLARDIYESMANEYLQILLAPETSNCSMEFVNEVKVNYLEACNKTAALFNYFQES